MSKKRELWEAFKTQVENITTELAELTKKVIPLTEQLEHILRASTEQGLNREELELFIDAQIAAKCNGVIATITATE
jgi:archaellum component FlaC